MSTAPHTTAVSIRVLDRLADRIDLAIDLLTLGQYGLERSAGEGGCERRPGREGTRRREAHTRLAHRAACEWEWPSRAPCAAGGRR